MAYKTSVPRKLVTVAETPLFLRQSDLLMVYAKARQENLTPDQKQAVRKLAEALKR